MTHPVPTVYFVFQSTHSHGVQQIYYAQRRLYYRFNPHTHIGCDPCAVVKTVIVGEFQSTHPHGVRLVDAPVIGRLGCVSIHAPTWGATPHIAMMAVNNRVSIHAPTWGATLITLRKPVSVMLFQSTHPHGVRLGRSNNTDTNWMFQSTHPHGVRRPFVYSFLSFQSVSIHAPTWGATPHHHQMPRLHLFQSTHPHGVRHCYKHLIILALAVSIHAPTWGATLRAVAFCDTVCFNPRTHMGCDLRISPTLLFLRAFQSTHPHGVRPSMQLHLINQRFSHINMRIYLGDFN